MVTSGFSLKLDSCGTTCECARSKVTIMLFKYWLRNELECIISESFQT